MTWQERAVCAQLDPELFFPDLTDVAQVRRAKARCATCEVVDRCRAEADQAEGDAGMGRRWGVWGGCTPAERFAEARGIDHGTPQMWRAGCRCDECQDGRDERMAARVAPTLAVAGAS